MNNKNVTLPHIVEKIVVQQVANYIVVYGFSGITVQCDGHNAVYVHMSDEYKGKTCGLCGNFNGDPSDDFVTLSGHKVSSVTAFANSFKMTAFGEACPDTKQAEAAFPCEKSSSQELAKIRQSCEALMKFPFSMCHVAVDPLFFFKMCQEDACSYLNDTLTNVSSCDAFTQYSRACARNGIEISWRNELDICRK